MRLNVKAPTASGAFDRIVAPDEAYQHRMDASPEELLGLASGFTTVDLDKAKKRAALVFHPDLFPNVLQELKDIIERRAQEENEAVRHLQDEIKREGQRQSYRRWEPE